MRFFFPSPFSIALAAVLYAFAAAAPVSGYGGDAAGAQGPGELVRDAEVLETMNAEGYTYVRVQAADGDIWAAGPATAVKVGDRVNLPLGPIMTNFHSASLDRRFEAIYFLDAIQVAGRGGEGTSVGAGAVAHGRIAPTTGVDVAAVTRAEGGSTIAELFAAGDEIAGKQVVVRGQVVKFNAEIMGRNWIHIQDGSGETGTNDLTVTTDANVKLGDIILVRGEATRNKDFGSGYRYDLIVEQASIEVE